MNFKDYQCEYVGDSLDEQAILGLFSGLSLQSLVGERISRGYSAASLKTFRRLRVCLLNSRDIGRRLRCPKTEVT